MTLASYDVRRPIRWLSEPVGRLVQAITVVIDGTNVEQDIVVNCLTKQIHFCIPALDDTDTAELLLHDADDNVIYASGEKAHTTDHVINVERALCGTTTLRIECSGDQAGGARAFTIYIYYV